MRSIQHGSDDLPGRGCCVVGPGNFNVLAGDNAECANDEPGVHFLSVRVASSHKTSLIHCAPSYRKRVPRAPTSHEQIHDR